MSCSIRNCNNQAIEELVLENGEINSFCKKNYYHSAKGWVAILKAKEKYEQTDKGKQTIKRTQIEYREKNREKESCRSIKYYAENKEKAIQNQREYRNKNKEKVNQSQREYRKKNKDKFNQNRKEYREKNKDKINQYQIDYREQNKDKLKEQRNQYQRKWNIKNREKIITRKKQYYNALKIINLSVRYYQKFAKSLILARNNQCERCSSTKKRLLVHHKKEPSLFPHLITNLSNCFVLCYSCHKIIHINSKERLKFYFHFIKKGETIFT